MHTQTCIRTPSTHARRVPRICVEVELSVLWGSDTHARSKLPRHLRAHAHLHARTRWHTRTHTQARAQPATLGRCSRCAESLALRATGGGSCRWCFRPLSCADARTHARTRVRAHLVCVRRRKCWPGTLSPSCFGSRPPRPRLLKRVGERLRYAPLIMTWCMHESDNLNLRLIHWQAPLRVSLPQAQAAR
jgi:hypothetical protein